HIAEPSAPGVIHGPALDELAIPLPSFGDPPDPSGGAVRHVLLYVVEDPAGDLRHQGITCGEFVELVAMQNEEPDLMVVVDILVKDLDSNNMADDVGRPIMIAADPD